MNAIYVWLHMNTVTRNNRQEIKAKHSEIKTSAITSKKDLNRSFNDLSQGQINYTCLIPGRFLCSLFLKAFNGKDFVVSSKQCIAALTYLILLLKDYS